MVGWAYLLEPPSLHLGGRNTLGAKHPKGKKERERDSDGGGPCYIVDKVHFPSIIPLSAPLGCCLLDFFPISGGFCIFVFLYFCIFSEPGCWARESPPGELHSAVS